jgi:hypothetical protein
MALVNETCILLPSLNRADRLRGCLESIFETCERERVTTVVSVSSQDKASLKMLAKLPVIVMEQGAGIDNSVAAWNEALGCFPNYARYVVAADDLIFHRSWYEYAMLGLSELNHSGLIGFNDLNHNGSTPWATHWMATRDFLVEHNGGVIYTPHYKAWQCDVEACTRAVLAGKYLWKEGAIVEHRHPAFALSEIDETYQKGQRYYALDAEIFANRQAHGFPDDFEPIITKDIP